MDIENMTINELRETVRRISQSKARKAPPLNPRNQYVNLRLTERELDECNTLVELLGWNRSKLIRFAINVLYESVVENTEDKK